MIERVEIRNFQSLANVDIEFGKLTVVVGASSSGKTALMRALRALASNVRGSTFITQGAKKASITAHTENSVITLEKGENSGVYKLTRNGENKTYTKLAGGVPEDITKALNLQPITTESSSINFAGQFDRPYLLDDSGATVARVLGELTNVSTIFAAVREANRRRASFSSTLKLRKEDFENLKRQAESFRDLSTKEIVLTQAEKKLVRAETLQRESEKLRNCIEITETAEILLSSTLVPVTPSPEKLLSAYERYISYRSLLKEWAEAERISQGALLQIEQTKEQESRAHEALHAKLQELGECPTCGTEIK